MTTAMSGRVPIGVGDQFMKESVDLWQMTEDFGDADDGEIFGVDDDVASGGAHLLSADAEELCRGVPAPQGLDQLRAIHFPRSFARRDEHTHATL